MNEELKTLLPVTCNVCGVKGMAYRDPKAKVKPHYCIQHNPRIHKVVR